MTEDEARQTNQETAPAEEKAEAVKETTDAEVVQEMSADKSDTVENTDEAAGTVKEE